MQHLMVLVRSRVKRRAAGGTRMHNLSFPKIISARTDDAAGTEWAWRQCLNDVGHVPKPVILRIRFGRVQGFANL
jgi:hypothetical protein